MFRGCMCIGFYCCQLVLLQPQMLCLTEVQVCWFVLTLDICLFAFMHVCAYICTCILTGIFNCGYGEGVGGGAQGQELGGKGGWCLGFHCNQTTMTQTFCPFRQTPQGVLSVQQQTHIQEHCRIRQSIWQGWLMHWHIHSQLGIAGTPSNPPPSTCLKQQIIFCSFPPMQFQSHISLMKHHPENKMKVVSKAVWRLPSHRHMDNVYNIICKVGASSRVPLYNFSVTLIWHGFI